MSVTTKFDKIMCKSVGKCQTYPTFRQFYPQFETFLPLKSLSCQFYVAKKPFRIIEKLHYWCFPKRLVKTNLGNLPPQISETLLICGLSSGQNNLTPCAIF